jgi:hypothetical protein
VKLIFLAFFIILSSSDEESAAFSLRFDFLSDRCLAGMLLRDGGAEVVFLRAITDGTLASAAKVIANRSTGIDYL